MKKVALILFTITFLSACGSDSEDTLNEVMQGDDSETDTENTIEDTPIPSTINRDNYALILGDVLRIYASQPMRESVYLPFEMLDNIEPDSSEFDQSTFIVSSIYSCANGGTAESEELSASATGYQKILYMECQIGEYVLDGEVQFNRSEGQSTQRVFSGYQVTNSSGANVSIDGQVDQSNYICRSDNYQSWRTDNFNWKRTEPDGQATIISNSMTFFGAGTNCGEEWRANMSGGFTLMSSVTDNKSLVVSIPTNLLGTQPESTDFDSGLLMISTDEDQSSLVLKADNGSPESVEITLSDGTLTETFDEPWTTWQDILVPSGTGK